jgi:hypothetical protein
MRTAAILISAIALSACTTTDLHHAVVHDVAGSDLTSVSMTPTMPGCEFNFIAVRGGDVVQGCLYRQGLGRLQVRWLP